MEPRTDCIGLDLREKRRISVDILGLRTLLESKEYHKIIDQCKSLDLLKKHDETSEIRIIMAISYYNVGDFPKAISFSRLVNKEIIERGHLTEAYTLFSEMSKIGAISLLEMKQPLRAFIHLRTMRKMGLKFDEGISHLKQRVLSEAASKIRKIFNPIWPLLSLFIVVAQMLFSPLSRGGYYIIIVPLVILNVLHFDIKRDMYYWILEKVL